MSLDYKPAFYIATTQDDECISECGKGETPKEAVIDLFCTYPELEHTDCLRVGGAITENTHPDLWYELVSDDYAWFVPETGWLDGY